MSLQPYLWRFLNYFATLFSLDPVVSRFDSFEARIWLATLFANLLAMDFIAQSGYPSYFIADNLLCRTMNRVDELVVCARGPGYQDSYTQGRACAETQYRPGVVPAAAARAAICAHRGAALGGLGRGGRWRATWTRLQEGTSRRCVRAGCEQRASPAFGDSSTGSARMGAH